MRDVIYFFTFTIFAIFVLCYQLETEKRFGEKIESLEQKILEVREISRHELYVETDVLYNMINGKKGDW